MRPRLVKLTCLVVLALPVPLALGALVAGAWPSTIAPAGPQTSREAVRSSPGASLGAGAQPTPAARAARSSRPSVAAAANGAKLRPAGAKPAKASAPARAEAIAATVSITLCAKAGTTTMPDGVEVNVWGFALGACLVAGPAALPGPVLDVAVDDVVEITLDNGLAQNVALAFPGQTQDGLGQALVPDNVGAAPGAMKVYTVTVTRPGTFLYEAGGPNAPRQVAMGLYGALLVRSATPGAYGTAASEYDSEAVLVLSEIDPVLNGVLPDPPNGAFDMNDYAPKYWLINGEAYDETTPAAIVVPASVVDQKLLLRYVNAALSHHTMELLGLHQRVIAKDAYPADFPFDLVSETFPTGQTGDMIVTIPGGTTAGTKFPLYSRSLYLTNGPSFPGGMLTFVTVGP